jgi:Carboxypeptidase regulatory-like domain/TonB-dependent Receptor Plug Domain
LRRTSFLLGVLLLVCFSLPARATIFGTVRGVVLDPQKRPIAGAKVTIRAVSSAWTQSATSNATGEFTFTPVTVGDYTVTVSYPGFQTVQQGITVLSSSSPVYSFQLPLETIHAQVTVRATPETARMQTVTPTTLINRTTLEQTPGASLTNSMAMITDYVPGSYITHDMLHIRGGHQVSWLIDGVELPNTNIAANLAPAIDPRDIDYLEALRGSYNAEYGDRTYGIFNVVPQSGFEYNRNCDLVATFGNFYQTDDQVSCGGHTQRFAYYFSLDGNRSNLGLQPPIEQVVHDAENGYGGFASFIFIPNSRNQFRAIASLRQDYYQVPIDPNPNSVGNQILVDSGLPPSNALRDGEREPDGYVIFTWLHTFNPNMQFTLSPFFHYNGANYHGGANDYPVITTVDQTASYGGMQATFSASFWKNNFRAGVYGFGQHQYNYFYNQFTDGSPNFPASSIGVNGGLSAEFLDDKFQPTSWLTLIAGLRQTEFRAAISENATDPRFGVDLRIPRLNWIFRAFYGYYYQAPPLVTATGALQDLADNNGFAFAPLHGERDVESQFGVTIPYRGWTLDADTFKTRASNWLDHGNIGESNLFWPITWNAALVRGWELTLRSPVIGNRGQLHLAYSNQIVENAPPVTGGLICPVLTPDCYGAPGEYGPADHDQRNTLNVGFDTSLPWEMFASTNVYYGSGFSNAYPGLQYPGDYLPQHTTFDLSVGKAFGENYSVSVTALNVANRRVQLDTSFTIGGFHWNNPREIYGQFRYRFNF